MIDYDTATLEDMRELGEKIALADQGHPVWDLMGEEPPPALPQMDPDSILGQYVARIMGHGEAD